MATGTKQSKYWQDAAADSAYRAAMASEFDPTVSVEEVETVAITSREDLEAYFASIPSAA